MAAMIPAPPLDEPDGAIYESQYLHAGQFVVERRATAVTTIVGSCVAVCLWDETNRIGGVNHYLLAAAPTPGSPVGRFGDTAIIELVDKLVRAGARSSALKAKIFGGACVMPTFMTLSGGALGTRNVEIAQSLMAKLRIPIISSDVGGTRGRKIIFHTNDGSAWVRYL